MIAYAISRDEVVGSSSALPSLPLIVSEILTTIDDADSNLNVLVSYVMHDPVMTARVLSLANSAAMRRQRSAITDVHTAITLIGMGRVREMALLYSFSEFSKLTRFSELPVTYWEHSVAVGVCSEELARSNFNHELAETALIAGLLHDIGQLWLWRFVPEDCIGLWRTTLQGDISIEQAEFERFGVDHSTIGYWLAEHWGLPKNICSAIRYHHSPESALNEPLVPLVYLAEILSNALDLSGRVENHVTKISTPACQKLGISWDADMTSMFGRIEARSRYANEIFFTHK